MVGSESAKNEMKMKRYSLSFTEQVYALLNFELTTPAIQLDREIDFALFEEAVNRALPYHPIFRTRLIVDNGLYYFEENPKPVKVRTLKWDEGFTFSDEDNNDYPWIILCDGRDILFTGIHALTDGMGMIGFLQTVLRIYLEMTGETFEGDFGLVDEGKASELAENPFQKHAVTGMTDPRPKRECDAPDCPAEIPENLYETDITRVKYHQFILDEQEIKALGKSTGTSAVFVISVFLAESLAGVIGTDSGYIQLKVPVDLRYRTGAETDRFFVNTPNLRYDIAALKGKPIETSAKALKSQLDYETGTDGAFYKISETDKRTRTLSVRPELLTSMKEQLKKSMFSKYATITYTHINRPDFNPQLLKYIRRFEMKPAANVDINASAFTLNPVVATSFDGRIIINPVSRFKDNLWEKKLEATLQKYGVHYEIRNCKLTPLIKYIGKSPGSYRK